MMKDFYQQLKEFKETHSLSYGSLGRVIGKNPDAFRQAVNRESLSDLETEKLEHFFKDPLGVDKVSLIKDKPLTAEDLIAKKVLEKLGPVIENIRNDMISKILALDIELTQIQEQLTRIEDNLPTEVKVKK